MSREEPLRKTKLHHPRPACDTVQRPRLLDALGSNEETALTVISAPAGFGKSTVASQWMEAQSHPSCWLSLDEPDNDLTTFLRYFIAALRTKHPEACPMNPRRLVRIPIPYHQGS